jgi:hypothetical protein
MKLLIRDYIGSLKERQELDAILPDLLSELGFNVYSRPSRGTAQRGVDVAAVGKDDDGERKVFLFSVKQGDLTRQDWNGTPQALRPALDEILDDYIPNRIPARYKNLKIVVCLCFGGDVQEAVRPLVTGYTRKNTKRKISFDEWNGDRIADLLLQGILREELLPKPLRSSFQKAVAMVDQPEIAFDHFARLVSALRIGIETEKHTVRVARQMYICLWVLFVWARDIDNIDAPYRASELVLLNLWHMVRPFIGRKTASARAVVTVVQHVISLHMGIAAQLMEGKILPYVDRRNALSVAVVTHNALDVNLKLYDMLGRLAMTGHWMVWLASMRSGAIDPTIQAALDRLVKAGMQLINNNPALFLPIQDEQAIEIALFLMFAARTGSFNQDIHAWLAEMGRRLDIAVRSHGRYPCRFRDYQDLIEHPKEASDEYRKDATSGSILIPLLAAWLAAFKDQKVVDRLVALKVGALQHCTLQLWLPEKDSEDHIYLNDDMHGAALADLPLSGDGTDLLKTIAEACESSEGLTSLSAYSSSYWPVILTACRHYRLPIPPQFWMGALVPPSPVASASSGGGGAT